MSLRPLRVALAALVLGAAAYAGARPVGPLPPLGPLLDPARGVWANARVDAPAGEDATAVLPGAAAEVRVVYDARGVPHIFATTEEDAYRALGWVVARDRLLQLHVQTLAAAGRLTELGGPALLDADREMRRLGLPRAAERKLADADTAHPSWRLVRAYADGINAYVDRMPAREMPVELRLLGARPPRWEPLNTFHLMNRMGWTLAYIVPEAERAAAATRVGARAAAALFPERTPIVEPIQPNGQTAPRVDPLVLPPPGAPEAGPAIVAAALDRLMPTRRARRDALAALGPDSGERWMASNNWAVAPRRTAGGHALLAGDPHLELTLPSIWYEVHLVVPGRLDVYGVTIPGAPGVVIGFNRDVAWTFTNTGADVLDAYEETVDDDASPTRYRLDGAWRPLERRLETYRGKGGEVVAVDTLHFTHRGPMTRVGGRWVSIRWTVLEPSNEVAGFHAATTARSARELLDALARWYRAPAQNVLVADRGGHIAIRSTGVYPVRPADGSGLVVRDGATSASDWLGWLPVEEYPQAFDPPQGFLASANQQPIDPGTTQRYWGGSYDPWRALRINALLRADSAVTPETMRRWQTDPGSERANLFVPRLLDAAARALDRSRVGHGPAPVDTVALAEAARLLAQWDRRYTRENTRAVLFEAVMRQLVDRTWDELLAPDTAERRAGGTLQDGTPPVATPARRVATPPTAVLYALLADPASAWWDDRRTPVVEDRDALIAAALVAGLDAVREEHGEPDAGGWTWSRVRHANVRHILQIPAFGALGLPVQGGPGTLSPSSGSGAYGPSWRMVVELGPEVRAWGIYPGGQSGHPASARYRDRLPRWLAGELDSLVVPRSPDAFPAAHRASTLVLRPAP